MMKMRRLLSLVLAVVLLSSLCACGGGSGITANDSESAAADTDYVGQRIPEPVTPEPIPTPTPEPTVEPTDPYDVLKMDEAARSYWASRGGNIYLRKNGNYYSLNCGITEENANKYQVGLNSGSKNVIHTYAYDSVRDHYISLGNIPTITVEAGDMIVGEGRTTFQLTPAIFLGYTIRAVTYPDGQYCVLYLSPNESVNIKTGSVKQFEMVDSQGNKLPQIQAYRNKNIYIPDFTNLIQDEAYTISWFEGTTYYEYEMVADSPYYEIVGSNFQVNPNIISIEGELHKEGYASFDLSDVSPGLYYTGAGGIFITIPE